MCSGSLADGDGKSVTNLLAGVRLAQLYYAKLLQVLWAFRFEQRAPLVDGLGNHGLRSFVSTGADSDQHPQQ